MAEVKWIKIVTDIFDDEKILLIESMPEADAIIVIWFKMLCLAGKQNNSGVFQLHGRIAYTDEMFATIFRRPLNTVRLALNTFEQFGMIEIVNDTVTIPNWGKHQSIEQIEARREYQRKYHQAYRKQQKLLIEGGEEPRKRLRKQDVNAPDKIREDKNREEEIKEVVVEGACACEGNPFGDDGGEIPDPNTVELYASGNLQYMSPTAMEELVSFRDSLDDEVIRHGIDVACDNGKRVWSYARAILNRYVREGARTIGEALASDERNRQNRSGSPRARGAIDRDNHRVPERYGGGEII